MRRWPYGVMWWGCTPHASARWAQQTTSGPAGQQVWCGVVWKCVCGVCALSRGLGVVCCRCVSGVGALRVCAGEALPCYSAACHHSTHQATLLTLLLSVTHTVTTLTTLLKP